MPMNNNQTVQSAAARLAKLPLVRSACAKLSVLYTDTKCSHPSLKSVCGVLESSVTALGMAACSRVSPVIVKLEPQISVANYVAWKSLDWLETSFPVLLSPTEQIVATAKNKMHEIQDVVSVAATGTVTCVQHTVTWVMSRMHSVDEGADQSIVERAISVASVGLDSALSLSEVLMDQVLPPSDEEEEAEAAHSVEGFETTTPRRRYPARLVLLTTKLCRRTYHVVGSKIQSLQVMDSLSRSSALVQDLQICWLTLLWRAQGLPQYLQHQALCAFFFIAQMYHLSCPPSHQEQSYPVRSSLDNEASAPPRDEVQAPSTTRMKKPAKVFCDNGHGIQGHVRC